jgi:hypothetical protein
LTSLIRNDVQPDVPSDWSVETRRKKIALPRRIMTWPDRGPQIGSGIPLFQVYSALAN